MTDLHLEKRYEQRPSTSELRLRVFGRSLGELFANAVFAMFDSQELRVTHGHTTRRVRVNGIDLEHLIIELLSEALFLSHKHREAYLEAQITRLSKTEAEADLLGSPIIEMSSDEIKAVTHHGVHITNQNGIYQTDILLDI